MYKRLIAVLCATVLTACGSMGNNATANNSANSKNNNGQTTTSNVSETNANASASPVDTTPLTMTAFDMVNGDGEKDKEGRMVTVTGGQLDKISYDSLLIRTPGGAAFYCYGDFSDYTKMADRIESLSAQGKAPGATVKGIYKVATVGTGGELNPCVLTDLVKP
jgi:hypothetical protein